MYGFYDPTYLVLIPAILFTMWAQTKLKTSYAKYRQLPNRRQITGAEAARYLLDRNGLSNIRIERVQGMLSDHFDPRNQVIRLSADIHDGTSIAAVSVAAHETGHAMQYGTNYLPLRFRNALAAPVNVVSMASWPLLLIGIVLIAAGSYDTGNLLFNIGVLAFAAVVLFHGVTLPVELDASRRAVKELEATGLIYEEEAPAARKMLTAAAMTYVAALATALLQLIRILLIRGDRR
ncbi:MAG: zinc metallopeptidase [Firmicutes bacterium]|jgi:Zn-dependent membrane protease YugP|nr:zinc metallopeptidase [Bacillota bacterium]MCR5134957.1 zinc metallopeptidase [Clostridiales bacterium]